MSTTIRVGQDVHENLKALKEEKELSSYEKLLQQLIENESKRVSMFGADQELEEWGEEDRVNIEDR